MSHELDTKANGVAAFFGRQSGWHTLGTVIDENLPLRKVLPIAGLDFPVETVPYYTRRFVATDGSGAMALTSDDQAKWEREDRDFVEEWHESPITRATMRTDRGAELGGVGVRYTPLQQLDAFGVLEPLLDAGVATIETAGALRGGADVWMLVRLTIDNDVVLETFKPDDKKQGIRPYGLIANNHSGRRQVIVMETPIRVVCANTLGMAEASFGSAKKRGRAYSIRHTLNVEAKTTEAAQALFGDIVSRYVVIARQYQLLRRTHLDTALFRKLVLDVAAPIPQKLHSKDLTKRQETSREQVESTRKRITELWTKGDEHKGDHSAFEAYNAVTQSVDHDADVWKTRGGDEGRLQALYDGRLAEVKQETLNALVAYAAQSPETEKWRASIKDFAV